MDVKKTIKRCMPPFLADLLTTTLRRGVYSGNYRSWEDARRASTGYDSEHILRKVRDSVSKVRDGEAFCERDSVLFESIQYSWPVLAGLLWIASRNDNCLRVVDFGGSLGSSYFQNRQFLTHLRALQWSVIEQRKFVDCGRTSFEDDHLRFYYTLDDCLKEGGADVMLLSSVMQYLEKPYDFLADIVRRRFAYVIVDRTPFLREGNDRITIQKVPPAIYVASYPSWFFNEQRFLDFMASTYDMIADFDSNDQANIPSVFKGHIFMLSDHAQKP